MPQLVKLMNEGSLAAISAVGCLVGGSERACDQARQAGAIAILAGFINMEDGDGQKDGANSDNASGMEGDRARREAERKRALSKSAKQGPALLEGIHELSELRGGLLEQASQHAHPH